MLMDEPFSAVDPIVRHQLQEEFLRLQGDLGKTIALVTHDIDEAVVLGDRIAVFREGGHLAQVGSPEELLTRPADDFVRNFVGRDRGYRGLGFRTADGLRCAPRGGPPRRGRPAARRRRDVPRRGLPARRPRPDPHLAHGNRRAGRRGRTCHRLVHHHDVADLLAERR